MVIKKAFISISSFTIISRVLGFFRDLLLASIIGVGITSDAFLIAFKLPNFFRRIFAEGAFNAAFVPLFAEILHSGGKKDAIFFAEKILSLLLIGTIIFVIFAQVFMPSIIYVFAPGYLPGSEQSELTIKLSRLTFPYLILISLVTLYSGILNSLGKFASVAFTPIILNLFLIIGITSTNFININSGELIAIAVTLAGIFQLLWLLFPLYKLDIKIFLTLPYYTKKQKEFFKLFLPGVIGASVVQINLLTDIIFASLLSKGSISFLYFADRINQLPLGVIGVALSTALLPILSKKIAAKEEEKAIDIQNRSIELALFFGIPAMFVFIFFPQEIIKPLFQRGAFTSSDTISTANALAAYAYGLPAYILLKIFSVSFFSRKNTSIPVKVAIFAVCLNILLNFFLIKYYGHVGLAMATAISASVNVILLILILLYKRWWVFDFKLLKTIFKILLSSSAMVLILLLVNKYFIVKYSNYFNEIIMLIVMVLSGLLVYIVLSKVFKITGVIDLNLIKK
ncbi:MAG: murein biosynthesis integral membrane protein MurJ [Rhodospirillaceae bacterium]|nr:murein biosynthesis integral membrane protein MurJ [Rhodospirillaceae bacterium]